MEKMDSMVNKNKAMMSTSEKDALATPNLHQPPQQRKMPG